MKKGLIIHTLILNEKGEILILQRCKEDTVLPEYWDIPGGTLEDGEDPAAGAIRETKEETGIDISNPILFFQKSNIDTTKNKQFITLIFKAKHSGTKIILDTNSHQKYMWIKPSNVNEYKTVEYLESCIKTYQNSNLN